MSYICCHFLEQGSLEKEIFILNETSTLMKKDSEIILRVTSKCLCSRVHVVGDEPAVVTKDGL